MKKESLDWAGQLHIPSSALAAMQGSVPANSATMATRLAMLSKSCGEIMTETMDDFCDAPSLMEKYVFNGINSFY